GFNGKTVPLQDRFYKGGDSFRGFANSGVGVFQGTNNGDTDAIGATTYAIGTVEMVFPLGLPPEWGIEGAVFSDFGTVFGSENKSVPAGGKDCDYQPIPYENACNVDESSKLRVSVGAGVVWQSPFGPLRFEAAWPLLKESFDETEWFRFSIGTRF
ncbi:MAG: BamA/TamA family outer membrane protein, partial [Aestuariivirga sp.]